MKALRLKATLKIGWLSLNEKCKRLWGRSASLLLKTASACHSENLLITIHPKCRCSASSSCGPTEFKRRCPRARRWTNNLTSTRKRRKMTQLWLLLLLCVSMKASSLSWSVQRSKHLWLFKFTNVINSMKSSSLSRVIRLRTRTTSTGLRTLVATGKSKKLPLLSLSLMSNSFINTSSLVLKNVYVSLLLLTDAMLLYHKPSVWCTVVPPQVPLEQERLRPLKISVVHLVSSSSSLTALMNTSSEIWPRSLKVFANPVFGVASMSSIVFHSLPSPSSLPKSSQSLKPRNKSCQCSGSPTKPRRSDSFHPALTSLQWTQVTLVVRNFPRTWRCFSVVWQWCCQTDQQLWWSSLPPSVIQATSPSQSSSMCFTSFARNSCPNNVIMTSVLETFFLCSVLLVTQRDLNHQVQTKKWLWPVLFVIWTCLSSFHKINLSLPP